MAFTRGMKRRGAPLPRWGRTRRRTNFSRKRRSGRNSAFSSQRGNTSTLGFRGRRMPRRQYRRALWNASTLADHHRSAQTRYTIHGTPVPNTQKAVLAYEMIANSFWNAAGGGVDGAAITFDNKIFIRGGVSTLRVRNSTPATLMYTVHIIRFTALGAVSIPTPVDMAWDPSLIANQERALRVLKTFNFSVESGDSNSIVHRIRSGRIDASDFNLNANKEFWLVGINNLAGGSVNSDVFVSHNISFTYDRQA